MNRAASLRMLDERAGYAIGDLPVDASLKGEGVDGFRNAPVPVRSRPRVAAIWIHPHETASHDYFWGGWMSVVVEKDQWILNRPGRMPRARAFVDITPLLHPKRMATKVRTSGFRKKD
jgi:hypothetical protein